MSFFKKSKRRTVDLTENERAIDKEIATGHRLAQEARDRDKQQLKEGEVIVNSIEVREGPAVSEELSRERNRRKYKDMSGIGQRSTPSVHDNYPTFSVFYLGRIPTSGEYGRECVEEPVDQLCRLRDKQKLPRVSLCFDTEGLTFREIFKSTVFKKNKKEALDIFIPLHNITYGVGSVKHPQVFACITRITDDLGGPGDNQVLMLHAFLCDKEEIAQSITYWQLQSYIEAYEELKRKKILRERRKQALGSKANPAKQIKKVSSSHSSEQSSRSAQTADTNGVPSSTEKHDSPVVVKDPPPVVDDANVEVHNAPSELQRPPSQLSSAPVQPHIPEATPRQQFENKGIHKDPPPPTEDEIRFNSNKTDRQSHSNGRMVQSKYRLDDMPSASSSGVFENCSDVNDTPPRELLRSESLCSESSVASSNDGSSQRDIAFEKRINELQTLMEMDAERLKKLMISNHASLAKQIYYDDSGNEYPRSPEVFPEDSQA